MSELVIDWKKAAENKYEVYPAATYRVECINWEETTSSKGTPQIRWFAKIVEPDKFKGKSIIEHTPLTDISFWRIANLVQAFGIDLTNAPKMIVGSQAFKRLLDECIHRQSYWLVTYNEQYNNNKIEDYQICADQPTIVPNVKTVDESPFDNKF